VSSPSGLLRARTSANTPERASDLTGRGAPQVSRSPTPDGSLSQTSVFDKALALQSIAGGVIHFRVAIEHAESTPLKTLFIVIGVLELASALAIALQPSRKVYAIAAIANGTLVTTWVLWHTLGLPMTPQAWAPEPASLWNSLAMISEALTSEGAAILYWSSRRGRTAPWQPREPQRSIPAVSTMFDIERQVFASTGRTTVLAESWVWVAAPMGRFPNWWQWNERIKTVGRSVALGLLFLAAVAFFLVGGFGPHVERAPGATGESAAQAPARSAGPTKQKAKATRRVKKKKSKPAAVHSKPAGSSGPILMSLDASVVIPGSSDMDCHRLGDAGWTVTCGLVKMAGGKAAWVMQHEPASDQCCAVYVIRVYTYLRLAGGWVRRLQQTKLAGLEVVSGEVATADITGDGKPELVVGVRFPGSGNSVTVTYDIVTYGAGRHPRVAFFRWVSSEGAVTVAANKVDEYDPIYAPGQLCCPAQFVHRLIRWNGSTFRAAVVGRTNAGSVPQSLF